MEILKENGVNISKRHERNDADSRDIVCAIFCDYNGEIITKYDIMRNKQIWSYRARATPYPTKS